MILRAKNSSPHIAQKLSFGVWIFGGDANGDNPIPVTFRYVNSGDSPALITGFGSRVMLLSEPAIPAGLKFSHQEIDPPIEIESGMDGFRLSLDTISPEEIVASGIMDTNKIACVGYVLYRDRNGTRSGGDESGLNSVENG